MKLKTIYRKINVIFFMLRLSNNVCRCLGVFFQVGGVAPVASRLVKRSSWRQKSKEKKAPKDLRPPDFTVYV